MQHPANISISDFTYDLPQEKIASYPLENRDESKLLVFKNGEITTGVFKNLDTFLEKDSILVFNATKVIQARLNFLNSKEQAIELFCLEPNSANEELAQALSRQKNARWNCLVGNLKRWKEPELKLEKNEIRLTVKIMERYDTQAIIDFTWEPGERCFAEVLEVMGSVPIPPYLKRQSEEADAVRYQTVYAENEGSVAAPTAGLHFTETVFEKLKEKGIGSLSLTLHVGAGTFKPVKTETMQEHDMHAEWMDVGIKTIEKLLENEEKDFIAIGTTSLRTLESLYWMGFKAFYNKNVTLSELEIKQWEVYELSSRDLSVQKSLNALVEWMKGRDMERLVCHTQILIAPPYQLKIAKGIVTNFHQPQSTLLLLVGAVVGDKWKDIYAYALQNNFRFLSYGDSSLLLK